MYSEITKNILKLPFQVKLMENTCIKKRENYPEVIKYHKHTPRERKKHTHALPLLTVL